jgi:hypothetical protein
MDFFTPSRESTTTPIPVRSPDDADVLSRFEKCVRQGDWNAVARLTDRLGSIGVPVTRAELGERLRGLQNALVAARVARAGLVVSMARLRAAARFTDSHSVSARQRLADPPDY